MKIMKILFFLAFIMSISFGLYAQKTWTSAQSGNWNAASSWIRTGGANGAPNKTVSGTDVVIITSGHTITAKDDLVFEGSSRLSILNGGKLIMGDNGDPATTFTMKSATNSFYMDGGYYESYVPGSGGNMLLEKGLVNWRDSYVYVSGNFTVKTDVNNYTNINLCMRVAQNIKWEGVGSSSSHAIMTNSFYISGTSGSGNLTFSSNSYVNVNNVRLNGKAATSNVEFEQTVMNGSLYSVRGGEKIKISNMSGSTSLDYYCTPTVDPNLNYFSGTKTNNCTIASEECNGLIVTESADLRIIKTVDPGSTVSGGIITYTLTATNLGPDDAVNSVVTDILPNELTVNSVNASSGTWTAPNWNIGSFPVGETKTLTIESTVSSSYTGTLTNTANITSSTPDPVLTNNESSINVIVTAPVGPTAVDDQTTTLINTPVDLAILSNDIAGSTPLVPASITFISGTAPNPATVGVFTVDLVTGLVTFTPANNYVGVATIDYEVCDQSSLCSSATITVTINDDAVVVGPTAVDDQTTSVINTPVDLAILTNDTEGSTPLVPASITFISGTEPAPAVGIFTINLVSGLVTFTPANNYVGVATIDYQVCDENSLCDIATITVTIINGVNNFFPAMGPGTLAFEDLWPGLGDYDFNDLVLDYQFEIISNPSNFVDQVNATFTIRAFGASYENGFGFQLSSSIDPADLTVSGYDLSESFISLEANGTESGQTKPTIIVYDNAFAQMPNPGSGIGVNTTPDAPYVEPVTLVIQILFEPNTYTYNDLDISNFNPFLIVNKVRGHEVHLPNYPPTDLINPELFGIWEDDSNPTSGKYYVTDRNLPWAINIYESFDYPKEKQDIIWAHLKFAEWATSGGVLFPDWYKNLTGYRDNDLIYQVPAGN